MAEPSISDLIQRAGFGDVAALLALSDAFFEGRGVDKDAARGWEWLRQAGEAGHVGAALRVATHYGAAGTREGHEKAAGLFKKALEAGSAEGEYSYANTLLLLAEGSPMSQAMKHKLAGHYKAAAQKGYLPALSGLGVHYLIGDLVPRSKEKACEMFRRYAEEAVKYPADIAAAGLKCDPAVLYYPLAVLTGFGCEKNVAQAYEALTDLHDRGFFHPARLLLTGKIPYGADALFADDLDGLDRFAADLQELRKRREKEPKPPSSGDFARQKLDELAIKGDPAAYFSYLLRMLGK